MELGEDFKGIWGARAGLPAPVSAGWAFLALFYRCKPRKAIVTSNTSVARCYIGEKANQ